MQSMWTLVAVALVVGHGGSALKLPVNPEVQMSSSPVWRVTQLLEDMKLKTLQDGRREQQSYDKYACWCERTLGEKAKAISEGKSRSDELFQEIQKLAGETAGNGANLKQLEKDIAANVQALNDATQERNNEAAQFEEEKLSAEQCVGGLEMAIKVLTGAGTGKKTGFLEMQQAQLMSTVAGVRDVISRPAVAKIVSESDMEVLTEFLNKPDEFIAKPGSQALIQQSSEDENPFGDYAPKSTQIQGILKSMYESFTGDIEKNNAEEANKQKSFEELKETKTRERVNMQKAFDKLTLEDAEAGKQYADNKDEFSAVNKQLKIDEKFFAQTKSTCAKQALEWAQRSRLRHEEVMGITEAIGILSSPEAKAIFSNSSTTFLQISSTPQGRAKAMVLTHLKALANKSQNKHRSKLSAIAREVTSGHFGSVIKQIDEMIKVLRIEEEEDIKQRDECEVKIKKNDNMKDDLTNDISAASNTIEHLNSEIDTTNKLLEKIAEAIRTTKQEMKQALDIRDEEEADFKKSLATDAAAINLLDQAERAMSSFYANNNIEMIQQPVNHQGEYTVDRLKAPELEYGNKGSSYGGESGQTGGIISIMHMIKEDMENEMKKARTDDAEAVRDFRHTMAKLKETLNGQQEEKVAAEGKLADLKSESADIDEDREKAQGDLSDQKELTETLDKECNWIYTSFDKRRDDRQAELEGLQEAKDFLAGASAHTPARA